MARKATIKSKALEAATAETTSEEVQVTNPNEETENEQEVTVEATETAENNGEETAPEEVTEGEVNVNPSAVDDSEENKDKKNVRVRLIKDFSTFIGGRHWYFEKGKVYNVPENVKFVLNRAGLLAVL